MSEHGRIIPITGVARKIDLTKAPNVPAVREWIDRFNEWAEAAVMHMDRQDRELDERDQMLAGAEDSNERYDKLVDVIADFERGIRTIDEVYALLPDRLPSP